MDPRLINFYNEELLHLRTEAAEFAREFPQRAARLALDESRVEDPYVERLLEGVAFLAARVRLKLDAQYPVFTQQLLDVLFPGWLAPSPSACVFRFEPDETSSEVAAGVVVPRNTQVRGGLRGQLESQCDFSTARALQLLPLKLVSASFHSAGRARSGAAGARGRVGSWLDLEIEVQGEAPLESLPLDRLPLFVTHTDAFGTQLMELLGGRCLGAAVFTEPARRAQAPQAGIGVHHIGFDADEALYPTPARGHAGMRLLKEFAALPDKFRFVEVRGLLPHVRKLRGRRFFLTFFFSGDQARLESAVSATSLALFCVPGVNLRERLLDRIDLVPGLADYHVVADKMRPRHYEVVEIVQARGGGAGVEREFHPLFHAVAAGDVQSQSYYAVRRERRMLTQTESSRGSVAYPGSELYLSVAEAKTPPFGRDLQYLSLRALCSNRDAPLLLRANFGQAVYSPQDALPVHRVECVAGPSSPLSSPADGFEPWVALSHFHANHLTLANEDERAAADSLRALLALHSGGIAHPLRRQAEGIGAVRVSQVTRRVPSRGPLAFARGAAVELEMGDHAFDGGSPFLLASVLENYLAGHAAVNSFVETALVLSDRGERIEWPSRIGQRPTF